MSDIASQSQQGPRPKSPLEVALESFDYHQPNQSQIDRITLIRRGHKELVRLIFQCVESTADRTAALRKLHECMMTCNKAIVLEVPLP